jgi:pimeloyl-ACP methyl ester carboxylesterase
MTSHDGTSGEGWSGTLLGSIPGELAALGSMLAALPRRTLGGDTLGTPSFHPVPVVLVHGIFGDPTNFVELRRHLARRGIRRFSSFAYLPRLDYPRLARRFAAHVLAVCAETGAAQVDVVGHSLGGLVARYFVQTGGAARVRRLVTLGTPYLAHGNPEQELAIFAGRDALVPPPVDDVRRRALVLGGCGHLALLTDARSLDAIARHLLRPHVIRRRPRELAA